MSSKPVVIYVDDEPHNLTVFEAAMPEDWQVIVFDNPLQALEQLTQIDPWLVVSDQRMPGMVGVKFLEIVKKTNPLAKRALVTGYSEEDLIIESVRKAGVHDYIRKPWDVDDLCHRMKSLIDTYQLESELREKTALIEKQVQDLMTITKDLQNAKSEEERLRKELEAWAPPFILGALKDPSVKFPLKKNLALITYDIVGSSALHELTVGGKSVRSLILKEFSELVIKHGGLRESHSGDSAYAHFGLIPGVEKPEEAALAVANEFRMALRTLSVKNDLEVECGIGLHLAEEVPIQVHTAEILTPSGIIVQKSFDSSSPGVDLVHRIEKLSHELPGSNIIMTESFAKTLSVKVSGLTDVGEFNFKGQKEPCRLFMKLSDKVSNEILNLFKANASCGPSLSDHQKSIES